MREILFKRHFFFDKDCTKYSHSSTWGVNIEGSAFKSPSSNNFAQNFIDCQFTNILDKNGKKAFEGDIIEVKGKHGFNSELLNEFKELNNLNTINGIGMHFKGIVRIDFLRGLMFESMENGYQEPMFTRHIEIKRNHSEIEIIGNIHEGGKDVR